MSDDRPRIASKARLRWDAVRRANFLLSPERGLRLNTSAAEILRLCDGRRTVEAVVDVLASAHPDMTAAALRSDVETLLADLRCRGLIDGD